MQYMEASDTHMDWLLRCHTKQQQLVARQQRVLEGLRARLERKIREVELARDRDLERLGRRVQVGRVRAVGRWAGVSVAC